MKVSYSVDEIESSFKKAGKSKLYYNQLMSNGVKKMTVHFPMQ